MTALLELRDVQVTIRTERAEVRAVRGVNLSLCAGETLAIVGESGCGKSMTALSIAGLLSGNAAIVGGDVIFAGQRLNDCSEREWNRIRGAQIGFIFQNPMSSFNPAMRIGEQIAEVLRAHTALSQQTAQQRAVQLLDRMRIANAAARARQYPFEMSGGMLQRAMIAMAIACEPKLLIADEPTTALDVTVQKEVLQLLAELRCESAMACVLITHDLGIVAEMCQRVAVMYAGEIVEEAEVVRLFKEPLHPYTKGLIGSVPVLGQPKDLLEVIPGNLPNLIDLPAGCRFAPRCRARVEHNLTTCTVQKPVLRSISPSHSVRCWLAQMER